MNGLAVCAIISGILYCLLYNWTFSIIFLAFLAAFSYFSHRLTRGFPNTYSQKVRMWSWNNPFGPEIRAALKVNITRTASLCETQSESTGKKITLTHIITKAYAGVIAKFPKLRGKLSFGSFVPYETIDIGCLVAIDEGKDLGVVCIQSADKKTLTEISEDGSSQVRSMKGGDKRKEHLQTTTSFSFIPTCVSGILLEICG